MNKNQFLEQLEKLLSDLPEEERKEAVAWYHDYFDDAGVENEADVIARLRSPEDVARNIKANLKENAQGGFTEAGYESFTGRDVPAKQEDLKKEKKSEYSGPFEYQPKNGYGKQTGFQDQTGYRRQDGYQGRTGYGQRTAYQQQGQDRTSGYRETGNRQPARTGRPAWAVVLLTLLGVAVIVVLAIALFVSGIGGVVCLFAGIGLLLFGLPAAGAAVVGTGLISLAVFILALLGEITFCRRAMPELMSKGGRRA